MAGLISPSEPSVGERRLASDPARRTGSARRWLSIAVASLLCGAPGQGRAESVLFVGQPWPYSDPGISTAGAMGVVALDGSRLFLLYGDGTNNQVKSVVGTVTDTTVTYGSPDTAAPALPFPSTVVPIVVSANQVVVGYGNSAVVGTVVGDNTVYGSPSTFPATPYHISGVALSATLVLIAYDDGAGNLWAVAGTVSGASISFGAPARFATGAAGYAQVTKLDATRAVLAYDAGDGRALVATVSANSVSYGPTAVFHGTCASAGDKRATAVVAVNATKVVAVCKEASSAPGAAALGTISGTNITFGSAAHFGLLPNSWAHFNATALSDTHIVVSNRRDQAWSELGVATVGDRVAFGSAFQWGEEFRAWNVWGIATLNPTRFAMVYQHEGDDRSYAIIGVVGASVGGFTGFETGDVVEIAALGAGSGIQSAVVRPGSGLYSLRQATSSSTLVSALAPPTAMASVRFSLRKPVNPAGAQAVLELANGSTPLLWLKLTPTGFLQVEQAEALGLTTTTSTATQLVNDTWTTVRLAYDSGSGGLVRVWVEGSLEIDVTHSAAGSDVDTVRVAGAASPNEYYYDDFFLDPTTVEPAPLGQIVRLAPDSPGSFTQFDTPVSDVNHWMNVDELSPNDADYNQHAGSSAARDFYGIADPPVGTYNAVKVSWRLRYGSGNSAGGTHNHGWQVNGVLESRPYTLIATSFTTVERFWTAAPPTWAPWTAASLGSLEVGADHFGTQAQDLDVSWVSVMVDYGPTDVQAPSGFSVTSVAGDTAAPYEDVQNEAPNITTVVFSVSGAVNCHWETSDVSYGAMTHDCGSTTTCTFSGATADGAATTYYIACIDAVGNENGASDNLDVSWTNSFCAAFGSDSDCNGVDEDCSGTPDDHYVPDTSCFLPGACAAGNVASSCAGVETPCVAGAPLAGTDTTCDGIDDDCDGFIDDEVSLAQSCPAPGSVCERVVCGPVSGTCEVTRRTQCCEAGADCVTPSACVIGACDLTDATCTYDLPSGCCRSPADCEDGDRCTTHRCTEAGACTLDPVLGCCASDADCDDGDPCSYEQCIGSGFCAYQPAGCATSSVCFDDVGCRYSGLSVRLGDASPRGVSVGIGQRRAVMQLRLTAQAFAATITSLTVRLADYEPYERGRPALQLALDTNGDGALDPADTLFPEMHEVGAVGPVAFAHAFTVPAEGAVDVLVVTSVVAASGEGSSARSAWTIALPALGVVALGRRRRRGRHVERRAPRSLARVCLALTWLAAAAGLADCSRVGFEPWMDELRIELTDNADVGLDNTGQERIVVTGAPVIGESFRITW